MSKQGYEPAPYAPLPTAPPPPYDAQPPYNPYNVPASQAPPYHYQPTPVIQETPVQGGQAPYSAPQYHPQPQPTQVTSGNTVVVGVVPLLVGSQPLRTTCPNCNSNIKTRTVKKSKTLAHLVCLGLCFIGCCLCSCIPYCMDSMNVVQHTCPVCKAHLGTYDP